MASSVFAKSLLHPVTPTQRLPPNSSQNHRHPPSCPRRPKFTAQVKSHGAAASAELQAGLVPASAVEVGTGVTNALISARKAIDKSFAGEAEDVPILSTSAAYGVYMAVSSNLRYQILAGVIEQRILEPLLHEQKLILSAICFVVRTGNTFLGSLMWVDYARWTGIQKIRE